jgi:hypothetical protein
MTEQNPARDDDPSDMTDFEKNTTQEELKDLEPAVDGAASAAERRERQERGNRGPDRQPGFGQGA